MREESDQRRDARDENGQREEIGGRHKRKGEGRYKRERIVNSRGERRETRLGREARGEEERDETERHEARGERKEKNERNAGKTAGATQQEFPIHIYIYIY